MSSTLHHHHFSEDDYFAVEARRREKHEWLDGQIFLMAGGSARHNALCANVSAAFVRALSGTCHALGADQRLWTPDGLYTYADASVACGTLELGREQTLKNPIVVVEVLSDATRLYDRGEKLARYQRIPSLLHVLLVEQTRVDVEHWRRGPEGWDRRLVTELDAVLRLDPPDVTLTAREIYGRALELP